MSTGKGGKSIWKSTGRDEGNLTREFCFVFLSLYVFCFSLEKYFFNLNWNTNLYDISQRFLKRPVELTVSDLGTVGTQAQ